MGDDRSRRYLVRCRISRGFFQGEVLVAVAESSAYVSRDNVKAPEVPMSGDVEGLVSAYVIERSGDRALIELPGQPIVGGARTWVPTDLLAVSA
jgi:hypothetical protein